MRNIYIVAGIAIVLIIIAYMAGQKNIKNQARYSMGNSLVGYFIEVKNFKPKNKNRLTTEERIKLERSLADAMLSVPSYK